MNVKQTFTFFENASETGDSPICAVPNFCDTLILEVSDTAASTFKMTIGGIVDSTTTTFTALQATNLSTGTVSNDISAVGIYEVDVDGLSNVEVMISSISGGSISVYGKLGNKYYN
jgi:hypothetical protein